MAEVKYQIPILQNENKITTLQLTKPDYLTKEQFDEKINDAMESAYSNLNNNYVKKNNANLLTAKKNNKE